jgi:hypothetical protein
MGSPGPPPPLEDEFSRGANAASRDSGALLQSSSSSFSSSIPTPEPRKIEDDDEDEHEHD